MLQLSSSYFKPHFDSVDARLKNIMERKQLITSKITKLWAFHAISVFLTGIGLPKNGLQKPRGSDWF